MDATRYLVVSGRPLMRTKPKPPQIYAPVRYGDPGTSWMV